MKKSKYLIALDIGGTKVEGVLIDESFKIVKKQRVFFDKKNSDLIVKSSLSQVLKMLDGLVGDLRGDKEIKGIGISYPGFISKDNKISSTSKIKALRNFDLSEYFTKKYKTVSVIANDADCFALAEQRLGAGKKHQNVVGVIIGTGVGSGLVINGNIYSGSQGSAGECGMGIVNPNGPVDRHGIKGTLEAYVGGANLVLNYYEAGGNIKNASPKEIFHSKEKAAKKAMKDWFMYLGIGLANIECMINPDVFILGGGLSNLPIYQELSRSVKKRIPLYFAKNVKILKNKLGDSAGIIGAAILVMDKIGKS